MRDRRLYSSFDRSFLDLVGLRSGMCGCPVGQFRFARERPRICCRRRLRANVGSVADIDNQSGKAEQHQGEESDDDRDRAGIVVPHCLHQLQSPLGKVS